jgi:hypothetical protein
MKTMMRSLGLIVPLLLAACGEEETDRIDTLVKMKILAVRADHPTLYPGEKTRVDVLVGAPGPTSFTTLATVFSQDAAADFGQGRARYGSAGTTSAYFPPAVTSPWPAVAPGVVIGARGAPNWGPVAYQAPATPGAYTLGVFVRPGVPDIDLADPKRAGAQIRAEIDKALKALKTVLVVPVGEPKNENPVIHRIAAVRRWKEVDGSGRRSGELSLSGFRVQPSQVLRLKPIFTDEKPKRPSAVWWITGGETNGNGRTDIDWVAPAKAGIETIICVLLDREGGADWYFQDVAVGVSKLKPDVPVEGTETLLALSGGRLVWLPFPTGTTAAALKEAVAKAPQIVRATLRANSNARLGWELKNPVYEGMAARATAETAQSIVGKPEGKKDVTVRVDEVYATCKEEAKPTIVGGIVEPVWTCEPAQ